MPDHHEPTSEDRKTVIDYLINENVTLKNQIANLKAELQMSKSKGNDDLISKINSKSLVLKGRVTDGMITEILWRLSRIARIQGI